MRRLIPRGLAFLGIAGLTSYKLLPGSTQQDMRGSLRSCANGARLLPLVAHSVHLYRSRLRCLAYPSEEYTRERAKVHTEVAEKILFLAESNRGVYLKAGQYISTLENIVPREYVRVLAKLQDSGPALPFPEVRPLLEAELAGGGPLAAVFRRLEPEALAAASLAQVHRGVLLDGREVAVKVQFPFLRTQTPCDLWVLRNTLRFLTWLLERYQYDHINLLHFYSHFEAALLEELDFAREARHAEDTRFNFRHSALPLHVPQVLQASHRVLLMEFEKGVRISDLEHLHRLFPRGLQPIGHQLNAIFAKMLFSDGHIHCDAHPGNILVRRGKAGAGGGGGGPQIVLLDHGFYTQLDEQFLSAFS